MLKNFPDVYSNIKKGLTGKNVCKFKNFTVKVNGVRMSGDMCTSLGNGFTNLMVVEYIASLKGGECRALVEGDDGLVTSNVELCDDDFTKLGFEIKINRYDRIEQTSFCGLVVSRENTIMYDPIKLLTNFPWSHSRQAFGRKVKKLGLLRAKALSLIYELPRCPIATAIGLRYEELTRSVMPIFPDDVWSRWRISMWDSAKVEPISESIRVDFELKYGIPVSMQKIIEDEIMRSTLDRLGDWAVRELLSTSGDSVDFWSRCVTLTKSNVEN